jgi:GNAT superfamily N-acetyltransferase
MTHPLASVRIATPDDAGVAARLLHDFNTEFDTFTPGVAVLTPKLARMIAESKATVLLGGEGPDSLAILRWREDLCEDGLVAYLEELYVAPVTRGRGLGRATLEAAVAEARSRGAVRMELGTAEGDVAARALYESAGFTNLEDGKPGETMYFYEREL